MKIDVAAEVAACLKSAPTGDCTTDQVRAWLFTNQNCVAVRLRRILQDKTARKLLTNAAGRTWGEVTDPEGKPQLLWQRLSDELVTLSKSDARALQQKVDFAPKGFLADPIAYRIDPPAGGYIPGRHLDGLLIRLPRRPLADRSSCGPTVGTADILPWKPQ